MSQVALVILFNHNYEGNIQKLESIYEARFKDIFFIMPFYRGTKSNVIKVYENSYYFQGYLSKALDQIKNDKYEHYLIIGDDLFLNPAINEANYKTFFQVDPNSAFLPGVFLLNDISETRPFRPMAPYWNWTFSALNFKIQQEGIEVGKHLLSYEEAELKLKSHGFEFTSPMPLKMFSYKGFFNSPWNREGRLLKRYFLQQVLKKSFRVLTQRRLPYPLIGSYSDCVIVPNKHVNSFIHFSGSFAALNLFVEIALPSAVAFSVPKIISEKDLDYSGQTYWLQQGYLECERRYKNSLQNLMEHFPDKVLYIHPIKLSKWQ